MKETQRQESQEEQVKESAELIARALREAGTGQLAHLRPFRELLQNSAGAEATGQIYAICDCADQEFLSIFVQAAGERRAGALARAGVRAGEELYARSGISAALCAQAAEAMMLALADVLQVEGVPEAYRRLLEELSPAPEQVDEAEAAEIALSDRRRAVRTLRGGRAVGWAMIGIAAALLGPGLWLGREAPLVVVLAALLVGGMGAGVVVSFIQSERQQAAEARELQRLLQENRDKDKEGNG